MTANDPEELQRQNELRKRMAAIGARYLTRTTTEVDELRKLAVKLKTDGAATLKEIEVLAHRIRGSGAVFGFTKLSDAAGAIEMLAVDSAQQSQLDTDHLAARFIEFIAVLGDEVVIATQASLASQ